MSNKTNIEEDIEYLEQFIGKKKEYKYKPIKTKTMINTRQAIENILADRERLEKENEENRMSILMYRNLRKCFQDMVKEILGEDYYNMGMDTYTCDKLACEDIVNKKVKIIFKGKDKELQEKANKYDSLVEKIKKDLIKLQEEYEILLEHQSGQESNRTKYLRGKIHMCQELLDTEKENQC